MNSVVRSRRLIWVAASALAFGSLSEVTSAQTAPVELPLTQQAHEIVSHLVGVMDTSTQAAVNERVADVQMTTCVVQLNEPNPSPEGTTYLYQEQGVRQRLDQPYRQRFLQISPDMPTQSVQSLAFEPAVPEAWIGFCDRPVAERTISTADLGKPICHVLLRPIPTGYLGKTPEEGCPTDYRGAVRITNQIWLHEAGMNTWDRGFDAAGNQVWGADNQAYQFRWVEPDALGASDSSSPQ